MRLRERAPLLGTFLNLGSPLVAEICAQAGFDWVLVDLEHGAATDAGLIAHMHAIATTRAAAIVRVEANEQPRFTRALDAGVDAIMVPRIDTADHARRAVSHVRYPPAGVRGVAVMNRAMSFGLGAADGLDAAAERVATIVQIESERALENSAAIAAVGGVDCLFVGPSDLTHSLGIFGQLDHRRYVDALSEVQTAAEDAGIAAGILARSPDEARRYLSHGYTFVGVGSDALFVRAGAHAAAAAARAADQ